MLRKPRSSRHPTAHNRHSFTAQAPPAALAAEPFRAPAPEQSSTVQPHTTQFLPLSGEHKMTLKVWGTQDIVANTLGVERDSLTMLPDGGYVVTFRQNQKIGFQVYSGNGEKVGGVRLVDSPVTGAVQQFSDVASVDSEGQFVIAWTESFADGKRALRTQTFNSDGTSTPAVLITNTAQADGAQITRTGESVWAVTYFETITATGTNTIHLVASSDPTHTPSVIANDKVVGRPDVAWIGGASSVVSYQKQNSTIGFKVFTGGVSGETTVAGVSANVVGLKNADGSPNGTFAVVANSGFDGASTVTINRFQVNAGVVQPLGAPTTIATGQKDGNGDQISTTALRGGGLAVAYVGTGIDNGDIFLAVIGANGVLITPPNFRVHNEAGKQVTPAISEMVDGRLAISWHDRAVGNGQIETTIVDARVSKIDVVGTSKNDVYAPSEFTGDTLDGKGGFDTLTFKGTTTGGVAVNLVAGNGTAGDAAGDTYTSFEKVIGSTFNDTLTGGAGHVLVGGAGNDTYYVSATSTVIDESGGGYDQVFSSATYTLSAGIENLFATGFDAINLTGNESDNIIAGNDAANRLTGNGGNDALYGNGGGDVLDGGAGNDALDGGAGDDALAGGIGNDVLYGRDGNDSLSGDDGDDVLDGGVGNDVLAGGNGNDNLQAGDGNDALDGGAGDDVINGGTGADTMNGGAGNDAYYIDNLGDQVIDGAGVDTVYVAIDGYDLNRLGAIENITGIGAVAITLTGNAFNNALTGNDGANILMGGAGNDVLSGGRGNDKIYGQEGNDVLFGGLDRDIFVFDKRPNKRTNVDKIADYNVRDDSIYLENKYFKVGSGSPSKPKQMASKYFYKGAKAHDRDDHIIYDNKKGILYYDADGTGSSAAVKIATLDRNLKMTYKDFFVI
ncbi:hypothetical protein HPT29_024360 [Microvirga terrae]|uniref:Calcium-binding protein n=1 Tax=Microvirga terrae TaxID=2740529 RepID=A0ABY5RR50_9HYPH|nr:calcium-binding protein [Microvirga terrae]UVF19513.1 hypothetical protein HPT29_024360 [Microvirga terrae]